MKKVVVFLKRIFIDKSDKLYIQYFRYFFVGGTAFVVDFGTLNILEKIFHVYYQAAGVTGFVLGLIVNYILSINIVFSNRNIKNKFGEFIIFALIGVIGVLINGGILWAGKNILKIDTTVSKIISAAVVFCWNFFIRKFILFRNKKSTAVTEE